MCEIPWENVTLLLLMRAARQHPEWSEMDCAWLAQEAEQHAIDRGADDVEQCDPHAALRAREGQAAQEEAPQAEAVKVL